MAGVYISVDPVGALRQTRGEMEPDPVAAATFIQIAGAAGVAASLGTESSPIAERDLRLLRETVHTRLIITIPAAAELFGLAMDLRPDLCVLVSVHPLSMVPRSGIDLMVHHKELEDSLKALQNNGIRALIFIDPQPEQVKLALQAGADGVVLNTHSFSQGYRHGGSDEQVEQAFGQVVDAIKLAHRLKLRPWLAGGLGYNNLRAFAGLPEIEHLLIGHSVITQALYVGLHKAVGDMVTMANQL
ncbi:MAG: pyridoxine 5'-phosphate synthase [Desulfosarcinaceae bacterium]|nr:pyridoxine 5'-phosphate synthase [Desulfosarcinaceae bacterium]